MSTRQDIKSAKDSIEETRHDLNETIGQTGKVLRDAGEAVDQLNETINQAGETAERLANAAGNIRERLRPVNLIREYPAYAASISMLLGFIAGRLRLPRIV